MPLDLSYGEICAKFDRLISDGVIIYQPSDATLVTDHGMVFCFHMVHALKDKPQADDTPLVTRPDPAHAVQSQPLSFGPGSDLANDHPDMCITTVNGTHYLVINKFPVFRPMLLLLTVDSYRRQHEPLGREDLQAAWDALGVMTDEYYVFFNCTVVAGSSRAHKHLQVVPAPGAHGAYAEGFSFFPDCDAGPDAGAPPFVHFLQRFQALPDGCVRSGDQLLEIYSRLLLQAREALNVQPDEVCPHNFVLTKRWMLVVPRRAKESHGLTANSAGMVGSVYLWTREQLDSWKAIGPARILAGLGLPRTP
ncbi:uncharacterized protein N7459_008240 [Penicillium hispanicum]|uniref:uncharacterized protein n=1 Tax=Penicillium hispanicum TaxID=1080232 RepID=UPI0025401E30|nr:uncharacterized protein N7459_008240 [Penicillium hispanicum]KAJ5573813.1 hypothetical protein N7459_008240 [Penicillium hispanicum]